MKTVELNDTTYAALHSLAAAKKLTVDELVTTLLQGPSNTADALMLHFAGDAFRVLTDPTERYLALLAWCATNHSSDFADFISQQESGHHYLMLSGDEFHAILAHNHARQIDGTQFWAVMTIEEKTKRRFVRRLLEFIGCRDETVAEACRALGFRSDHPWLRGAA